MWIFLVKIFLRIFHIIFQNFYIILSYLLYELTLFRKSTSFFKIFHIYELIMKYRKISKIFCKYNFWWNIIKAKKNIFFLIMGWENLRIFQNMNITIRIFLKNVSIPIKIYLKKPPGLTRVNNQLCLFILITDKILFNDRHSYGRFAFLRILKWVNIKS